MGSRDFADLDATRHALDWARTVFNWHSQEPVTHTAWAKTVRLQSAEGTAFLKILPPQQAPVIAFIAALAQHFAGSIPRLLAHDAALGTLLAADHGGHTLGYDAAQDELLLLVRTYARLQADAARHPALLAGLPRPAPQTLTARLLDFLAAPAGDGSAAVGAAYFIGDAAAARYHRLLEARRSLLEHQVALAQSLPDTLNHGDLRPPNAAITPDGSCLLMDWDDAVAGPAGLSLQGLFSGATRPTLLLTASAAVAAAAAATPQGQLLQAYTDELAAGGYASAAALRAALPGSLCAGVMLFILNFGRFPGDVGRRASADTVRRRLSDLLDLCDLLASRGAPAQALAFADDYDRRQEYSRARRLYQDLAAKQPDDALSLARLGRACRLDGDVATALEAYDAALALAPQDAAIYTGRGTTLLEQARLDEATAAFQQALHAAPCHAEAAASLARAQALCRVREQAAEPDRIPVLRFDADRLATTPVRPEQVALGAQLFNAHGVLQIDNAFPVEVITRVQQAFFERYQAYFREGDHPDALRVGDKRYMLTVDLTAPFDSPELIGAATVLPIIRRVLGEDCVLGAFTAVVSLPGSRDQRLHKDHPALFPDTDWHHQAPSFATQIIIPLVPLDEMTGTTRFFKGSHRVPTEQAQALCHQDPVVPLGSCLLTDYRCAHRGLGNRSQQVRPILTLIYNRPWFRDFANYGKQPPLRLPDASFAKLPTDLHPLLAWWKQERAVDNLDQAQLA